MSCDLSMVYVLDRLMFMYKRLTTGMKQDSTEYDAVATVRASQ